MAALLNLVKPYVIPLLEAALGGALAYVMQHFSGKLDPSVAAALAFFVGKLLPSQVVKP